MLPRLCLCLLAIFTGIKPKRVISQFLFWYFHTCSGIFQIYIWSLFVLIFLVKEDFLSKSFFRQWLVLLFGTVGGSTDRHGARGSRHSLRRWQVHNCHCQLQLGWVGPGNFYLCRHFEGRWKLHKDWLSTHKLPGHVSIYLSISWDSRILHVSLKYYWVFSDFQGWGCAPKISPAGAPVSWGQVPPHCWLGWSPRQVCMFWRSLF